MVLESMINPKNAEDKPWHVFVIAFIYTIIAILFAYILFPDQSSLLTVALITMLFIPFFQKLFVIEEKKEDRAAHGRLAGSLWQRHNQLIFVFSAFFLGVIVAMSFVFMFFPNENLFSLQSNTLHGFSGAATQGGDFSRYFLNNTQVMIMIFILSLTFGAGSIFILTWNASVIAVYVGLFAKSFATQGFGLHTAYLFGVPVGLGSIALHGIPEILAYFVAGVGGGILSVGIIREKLGSKNFSIIAKDSIKLLVAAEVLVAIAAFIEAI
ncbi:MAG: stage II sporulation protein M [Candidatus Aenigmarchaeota archaeon]|nr:stage II sporulation protein M [Candidatus Aenigmarchaeota archaeon]